MVLAVAGDLVGFEAALSALSDASPAELAYLHPQSVGETIYASLEA